MNTMYNYETESNTSNQQTFFFTFSCKKKQKKQRKQEKKTHKNPKANKCLFTSFTYVSCPTSITSFVTLTSHMITDDTVFTMSYTLLATIDTVPSLCTFWLNEECY